MNNRTSKLSLITLALACGLALQPLVALAQEQSGSVSINNTAGRVSVRLDRGSKVAVSNRYGRITITGWDRDTVEAVATSEKGPEAIKVDFTADPQSRSVLSLAVPGRAGERRGMDFDFQFGEHIKEQIKGQIKSVGVGIGTGGGVAVGIGGGQGTNDQQPTPDSNVIVVPNVIVTPNVVVTPRPARAPRPPQAAQPGQPTPQPAQAPRAQATRTTATRIDLDVKIPRYAELSAIEVRNGDLTVTNVDGPVNITSGSSDIKINHVGAVEIKTGSGSVLVEDVKGLAYVSASNGDITVRRVQGDVRAVSLNGDMDIQCVRGRVDVSNARGAIKLGAISGDVDATTTSSNIVYTGAITDNGNYRLKAIGGEVSMAIPDNSPGFTALLSSYSGDVLTDFAPRSQPTATGSVNHRVEARQGNGQARITLDSFNQPVRLTKLTTATVSCQ